MIASLFVTLESERVCVLSLTNLFYEDCAMDGEMGEINKPGNTRKRRD